MTADFDGGEVVEDKPARVPGMGADATISPLPLVIAPLLGFMRLKYLQNFGRCLPVAHGDRCINRFLRNFIQVAFRGMTAGERRQTIIDSRLALPGFIDALTHIDFFHSFAGTRSHEEQNKVAVFAVISAKLFWSLGNNVLECFAAKSYYLNQRTVQFELFWQAIFNVCAQRFGGKI